MWYSKQLRLVRQSRKVAKNQQHRLLVLELEGIVAITLHSVTQTLLVPIERAVGGQVVDTLREALRDQRRALKAEAYQLRQDWQESGNLRAQKAFANPKSTAPPLTATDESNSL